jgi:hypothetical protein
LSDINDIHSRNNVYIDVHEQGKRLLGIQNPKIIVSFPKPEASDKGKKRKSSEPSLPPGPEWMSTKSGKNRKSQITKRESHELLPEKSNEIISLLDSDDDVEGDALEVLPKRTRRLSANDARRSITTIATDEIDSDSENEFE